jgi:hypothetical protein
MRVPALLILPLMVLLAVYWSMTTTHPFSHGGAVAWPLGFAAVGAGLWLHEEFLSRRLAQAVHLGALWLLSLLASWEMYWQVHQLLPESVAWAAAAWALPPAALFAVLSRRVLQDSWPVRAQRELYWRAGALGLAILLAGWSIWLNIASDGSASPLPYLPLFNPLDIAVAVVLTLTMHWLRARWREDALTVHRDVLRVLNACLAGVLFLWLNGILLRTIHHWLGIPYQLKALLSATEVQTALSIFWTLLALGAMLWANRSAVRLAWFGGAGLMGIVVAKLFLVDLARIGTIPRIVSFLGVGALMLVIGYYSPLPPAARKERA